MAKPAVVRVVAETNDFNRNINRALGELNKFSRGGTQSLDSLGRALGAITGTKGTSQVLTMVSSVGKLAGAFGLTASAASLVSNSVNTALNFEKSMSSLKALTGLGGEEMDQLKKAAIDLGSTTTQSASQVADAFRIIGSAKPELLSDVDALKNVTEQTITLAEASGIDVPEAAKALTTSLNQMGAGADQATRFVNVLAAGSQKGAGDINWLNEAITQSGTAANAVGTQYEELVANLEQLAQGGYQAGAAGTALRSIIMSLEKQGNSNLKPSVVGLTTAFSNLGRTCNSLTDYQKLLGKEMAAQGKVLADNAEKARDMQTAITGTNTAQEQARINTDNFAGAVNQLSSAWEGLMLTINSNNGFLRSTVDQLREAVEYINELLGGADAAEKKAASKTFNTYYKDNLDRDAKFYKDNGYTPEQMRQLLTETANQSNTMHGDNEQQEREYQMAYQMAIDYIEKLIAEADRAKNVIAPTTGGTNNATDTTKASERIKQLKKEVEELNKQLLTTEGLQQIEINAKIRVRQEELAKLGEQINPTSGQELLLDPVINTTPEELIAEWSNRKPVQLPVSPVNEEEDVDDTAIRNAERMLQIRDDIKALHGDMYSESMRAVSGFMQLGDTIADLGHAFDDCKTAWDYFSTGMSASMSIINGVVEAISAINAITEISALLKQKDAAAATLDAAATSSSASASLTSAASAAANTAALEAEATAAGIDATAQVADASAKTLNAHAMIPFVGVAMGIGMVSSIIATLQNLPKFAQGAYADRPTLGIFGEAGPELVLPERKLDEAFERHQYGGIGGRVKFEIGERALTGWLDARDNRQKYN